jgi:CMP-N-acetylneuraminic acid synthetase
MHDGSGLKPRIANNGLRLERDDLYKKSGGITLVTEQYFLNEKKIVGGRIGHIQLDQTAAFSVQSELDWTIANVIESKH